MPLSLKALIGSPSLQESTCYGTLPMLTPVLGQDIYSVGQVTVDVGKTTSSGYRSELQETPQTKVLRSQKFISICLINVTHKQMWFDLIIAGIPPAKRNLATQHCVLQPVGNLKPEQQFRPTLSAPTISDVLPAPMKASGIQFCSGWVPPCSWVNFRFYPGSS